MFGMFLTFLKLPNTVAVALLMVFNYKRGAAVAIGWLIVCDMADGWFYRRSRWAATKYIPSLLRALGVKDLAWFRRICDVIGDHIAVETCLGPMVAWFYFPHLLYFVVLVRDIFLFRAWAYGVYIGRPLREPNLCSRLANLGIGASAIAWLLYPGLLSWLLVLWIINFGVRGTWQYSRADGLGAK